MHIYIYQQKDYHDQYKNKIYEPNLQVLKLEYRNINKFYTHN